MKHLYIARHGESEANAADIYSPDDTELTDRGREQARSITEQCTPLEIDVVVTSDLKRAKDTAAIVQDDRDIPLVEEPNLREITHPSEIIGKSKDDEAVKEIVQEIREHADDPHWRYSDEENFVEFRERMIKTLLDIRDRDEQSILAVTHSHSLVMLTAILLCGKYVDPAEVYRFEDVLVTDNTGLTYVRMHNDLDLEKAMELVTWNNISHLGSLA